jgi:hypothetical protein
MNAQAIVGTAVGLVLAAIIMSTVTWEIDVVETYNASEPYSYEQELVRVKQVQNWPWFWQQVTQAQYLVKNTDLTEGTFTLNFLFDNGIDAKTKTEKASVLAGENKAITKNSPLQGISTASLNVVPPNKSELRQQTVKKTVNAWYYVPGLKFLFFR